MPLPGPNQTRAFDRRPRSLPSDRLMALRPAAPRSTFDIESWELGREDAIAGKPWRLTPAAILGRGDGAIDPLSYMAGHRAGELERAKGG